MSKYGKTAGSGVETTADGYEHLTYKATVPDGANYLRVSYRQFNDGHCMVEKANIPSQYAINPKDLEKYADDQVSSVRTLAEQTADHFTWLVESGTSSSNFTLTDRTIQLVSSEVVIKDPSGSATVISGGNIQANSLTTNMFATNAIKSLNYNSGRANNDVPSGYYSTTGSFLDLSTGNFYTPNFSVKDSNVYVNGEVNMLSGQIGDVGNSYWQVGTTFDENFDDRAAIIANGNALIQTGKLTLSNDRLNSLNAGNYINEESKWYDYGLQIPDRTATGDAKILKDNFLYIRNISTKPTASTLEGDWNYLFKVDKDGTIYENGVKLSDKYASIDGVSGVYLPLTGGTISGNLTVEGTLTATASQANKLNTTKTIKTNLESTSAVAYTGESNITPGVQGTLGVGNGGTGKASWTANGIVYASSSSALSQMSVGTSGQVLTSKGNAAPAWTNQSALSVGSATKATQDANGDVIATTYRKLDNTTFDSITVTNGISGTATRVSKDLVITLNGGTTEGTNKFTYNGSTAKAIALTRASIGLGNVENTQLSTWTGSANLSTTSVGTLAAAAAKGVDTIIEAGSTSTKLPTSEAVASFVEGKGYVTSSGVTSITLTAGAGISLSATGAITSTGSRTITNSGVRAVTESTSDGKIKVNTGGTETDVPVHGLGSWAYKSSGSASDVGLGSVTNNK